MISRPSVPIVMAASDSGTEEGRAFHQSRLALFGRWVCLVSGAFLAFFGLVRLVVGMPFDAGFFFHVLATATAGMVWAVSRRRQPSVRQMQWIDLAGTWAICASFAAMTVSHAATMQAMAVETTPALFAGLLASTYTVFTRAIAVPSTAVRTLWVGFGAMVPLIVATALIGFGTRRSTEAMLLGYVDMLSWQIAAVAMSAVASRVIYGLRAEVLKSRRLGQYTLGEKIGEGGMGVVYRARHAMLRRPTAIKLLPPERAGAEGIQRFEREVQLTASLSHPNTVAIFDYGRTVDGVFYYAMEDLDGINLDTLVRRDGPQPTGRVIRILRQVSGALAEAHGIGLVHRDIKPANIILCERGGEPDVAKVVDFGLVKRFRSTDSDVTIAVTTEQTIMGTPLYMAPESVGGSGEVDARSDLYALGAVGYFLLTGTPVFSGRTAVEILAHHLHSPPEPPSRRLGRPLPNDLERIVLRCLSKSPDDRPTSARLLHDELERLDATADWSTELATQWWEHFRAATAKGAPPVEHAPDTMLLTVQR